MSEGGGVLIASTEVGILKVGGNFPWYGVLYCLRAKKASRALGMHVSCSLSALGYHVTSLEFLP